MKGKGINNKSDYKNNKPTKWWKIALNIFCVIVGIIAIILFAACFFKACPRWFAICEEEIMRLYR